MFCSRSDFNGIFLTDYHCFVLVYNELRFALFKWLEQLKQNIQKLKS